MDRAPELDYLLKSAIPHLVEWVRLADKERACHSEMPCTEQICTAIVSAEETLSSTKLEHLLAETGTLDIPQAGIDNVGMESLVKDILKYSVNTSAPGFLDKLYAAPLPPGILAELVLAVLNTNVHIYHVSPILTLVEKCVTRDLAKRFGLKGPRSGGISVQGGSASNMTSMVIARNTLFPVTRTEGNAAVKGKMVILTSAHGHYSIEKAAQAMGLGSKSVISVPVDGYGRMIPAQLERLILEEKTAGNFPFYVNVSAGSTVLGSFDPFTKIREITRRHGVWMHVDAAWGGGFAFSRRLDLLERLRDIGLADSIATNPHKMLGVPVTCSFLLGQDMRQFQQANTLKAGYLFHDEDIDEQEMNLSSENSEHMIESAQLNGMLDNHIGGTDSIDGDAPLWKEPYDIADLTLQCGRRGDSLKMFFCLKYYGSDGYAAMLDHAYDLACYATEMVKTHSDLTLLLEKPEPSCLQVCFYFTPAGRFVYGSDRRHLSHDAHDNNGPITAAQYETGIPHSTDIAKANSSVTSRIARHLVKRGFMIDFAPALEGAEEHGSFFRVVINISSVRATVDRLLQELVACGHEVIAEIAGTRM